MAPAPDTVLLLTHSGDHYTVDRVAAALQAAGLRPLRFDTDLFPSEIRLICAPDRPTANLLSHNGSVINASQVRAVWLRKLWAPAISDSVDERFRDQCAKESRAALAGFLDSLHSSNWIDHPDTVRRAENKPYQLRVASEVGLTIPRTLITNDPSSVRAMYQELRGELVVKMLTP